MSDEDLSRSVSGMKGLEAALARFMDASAAARQRLSDAAWADLVKFREDHPEVTLDEIIAIHNEYVSSLDAMAAPFPGLAQRVKDSHSVTIDALLDERLRRRKR